MAILKGQGFQFEKEIAIVISTIGEIFLFCRLKRISPIIEMTKLAA
jgi:hypothetical protein